MEELTHKKILLGITGGIAAYKCPELVRQLTTAGAEVKIVMRQNATQFVTPLSLQAVSGHPVYPHLLVSDNNPVGNAMEHIELARWADLILVAPATANFLAQHAHGLADDLLTTLCLAADGKLLFAPAMNQHMWNNAATQNNVSILVARGIQFAGPAEGQQACGETGPGRMLEPTELVQACAQLFSTGHLTGKTLLITAGPTREPIDPARFISNRSSGKMGYALAAAARAAGGKVILISGPVNLTPPKGITTIHIDTAENMHKAVMQHATTVDIFISAAAVADYRPVAIAPEKIKKSAANISLEMTKTKDILQDVAAQARRPFCVGFAAETENLEQNALDKLRNKGVDMLAANWIGTTGDLQDTGFDSDNNALQVFTKENNTLLRKTSKTKIAQQLIELISEKYYEKNPA